MTYRFANSKNSQIPFPKSTMIKNIFDTTTYYTLGANKIFYYLYGRSRSLVQPFFSSGGNITKITSKAELYISDVGGAYDLKGLKEIGITHIVNAVLGLSTPYPNDFKYLSVPLRDIDYEDISQYFDSTNDFINEALDTGGKVVVHCIMGASRSVTLIAANIIHRGKGNVTVSQAIDYIQQKRALIHPNSGFLKQLEEYYKIIVERNKPKIEEILKVEEPPKIENIIEINDEISTPTVEIDEERKEVIINID